MILNISRQRPEVIKKENQLHHKTKELKDLPQWPAVSTLQHAESWATFAITSHDVPEAT